MKAEEKIARNYFISKGYRDIIFEPKGNRPPDLLLNNKIAVEVRRLNHIESGEPIEKLQYKLLPKLYKIIHTYGTDEFEKSTWVDIKFFRPLKVSKELFKAVEATLSEYSDQLNLEKEYHPWPNLSLKFFPAGKKLRFKFNIASSMDGGHGGFVVQDIYESLKIIISEKKRKVEPYKEEFEMWWLALIDHIGYGLSDSDLNYLKEIVDFPLHFERVIFISPLNDSGTELTSS